MRERKKEKSERAEKRQKDLRSTDADSLKVYSFRLSKKENEKVQGLALLKGWNKSDAIREMISKY
jgi:hypothetical protein